jgi:hypothetical protein
VRKNQLELAKEEDEKESVQDYSPVSIVKAEKKARNQPAVQS